MLVLSRTALCGGGVAAAIFNPAKEGLVNESRVPKCAREPTDMELVTPRRRPTASSPPVHLHACDAGSIAKELPPSRRENEIRMGPL